jgi:hypothetical protein
VRHASFASTAFGASAIFAGVPIVVVPGVILGLLGLPPTDEPWARLWAMEVAVLGFYYVAAGRADLRPFFVASVRGRLAFAAVLVVLVVAVAAPWQVLIVGALDTLGALWTAWALRYSESRSTSPST